MSKKLKNEEVDLDKEKDELIKTMKANIPKDLMEQIDYFASLISPAPKLRVWTSSNGTRCAN